MMNRKRFSYIFYFSIQMEEEEDDEGGDNDNLIDDILTSDEEEEEDKTTTRKTKLVPVGEMDEADQETLRSLSFNERTKRTTDSSTVPSSSRSQNFTTHNKDSRRETTEDHRKNIRRAPRGRMNSRRSES
jgi:hypothetical protein